MRFALRLALAWLSLALCALGVGAIEAIASPVILAPGHTWGGLIGLYMVAAFIAAAGLGLAYFWLFTRGGRP